MKIKDLGADIFFAGYGLTRGFVNQNPPGHYLGYTENDKNPIVIIPGLFGRWSYLKSLGDKISLKGHPVYVVPSLGNNISNTRSSAKSVKDLIDKINLKDFIIIGHSKGGLIGKYILTNHNEDKKVKGLISIGTPFYGSHLAEYFKFLGINEFFPDSPVIKELNAKKEVNKRIIAISFSYDNIVWHEKGTTLKGAFENIEVPVSGHHKGVFDDNVHDIVIESVNKLSKL